MRKLYDWQWDTSDLLHEVWKTIPGFDDYEVSNLGRVKRCAKPPPSTFRARLLVVKDARVPLYRDRRCCDASLARIMLEAFIEPPPSPQHVARHLDDNRNNNQLSNLAWGTPLDNAQDAVRNGRLPDQRGKVVSTKQRQKARESAKRAYGRDPTLSARQGKSLKSWWAQNPVIWVTNGVESRRVAIDQVPEGWRRGFVKK